MGIIGNYIAIDSDIIQKIQQSQTDFFEIDPDKYPTLDIDKSWEAIHFLLCGVKSDGEPPLGNVVPMREENELNIEMDYGAFALTYQQVRETYLQIKDLGEQDLRAKYDIKTFVEKGIYPTVSDEDEDNFFEYIYENFKLIQDFYKESSENNVGIIFYIM